MAIDKQERIVFSNDYFTAREVMIVDTETKQVTFETSLQQHKSIEETVAHLEQLYANQVK